MNTPRTEIGKGAFFMPTTPFVDGTGKAVDETAFAAQVERIVKAGGTQIICGAASGEAPSLTPEDMITLTRVAIDTAQGKAAICGSLPWQTDNCVAAIEQMLEAGVAAFMTLPPDWAYVCDLGVEKHLRRLAEAADNRLIIYQKGPSGMLPSDDLIRRLAGEGRMIGVKRACDSWPFRVTAKLVRAENPQVKVWQGGAERMLLGTADCADGYTTGTGCVFPHLAVQMEDAFLRGNFDLLHQSIEDFLPIEIIRQYHNTGYNIAPLKWLLRELYNIGNAITRDMHPEVEARHEAELRTAGERLVVLEAKLAGDASAAASSDIADPTGSAKPV